jgi:hypothetical protein
MHTDTITEIHEEEKVQKCFSWAKAGARNYNVAVGWLAVMGPDRVARMHSWREEGFDR